MTHDKIKILVLGDIGVGKTSLCRRLAFQRFDPSYKATIGADIYGHKSHIRRAGDSLPVEIALWDLDGDLSGLCDHVYMSGAQGALIVSDVSRPPTQISAINYSQIFKEWFPERPSVLVANKIDLLSSSEALDPKIIAPRGVQMIPASAKTGKNIEGAVSHLARLCLPVHREPRYRPEMALTTA